MNLQNFILWNAFKAFECRVCGAILKAGSDIIIFAILTIIVLITSLFFTFPKIDQMIDSFSNNAFNFILEEFLPYAIIALQAIIFCIPVEIYAWNWGKLEIIKKKNV
jgi:hypothetical protein